MRPSTPIGLASLVLVTTVMATAAGGGNLTITSSVVVPGRPIPAKYTCQGADVSPPVEWSEAPSNTKSFALVVEDPDAPAGTWVHWILFNVMPTTKSLPEGVPANDQLADGSRQGRNDFKRIGYGGPCPPPGPSHRYFFKLYALDRTLDLNAGATKADLDRAMAGHILAQAELVGTYQR